MSYGLEVDLVRLARSKDMLTTLTSSTPPGEAMAKRVRTSSSATWGLPPWQHRLQNLAQARRLPGPRDEWAEAA